MSEKLAELKKSGGDGAKVTKLSNVAGTKPNSDTMAYDITALYPDYANLTIDDIAVEFNFIHVASSGGMNVTMSYTYANGVISCYASVKNAHLWSGSDSTINVYIFK